MLAKTLRNGLTTGTCATCALKAALILLQEGDLPDYTNVKNPQGEMLTMPIAGGELLADSGACAWVIKDAGDDIDVTHGAKICVKVAFRSDDKVVYHAGKGVGIATKPGLYIKVGEPAINRGPKKMMQMVIEELLSEDNGIDITISVEDGEELAKQTLNPVLGIEGGISIIGTTGIVRPMSEEAFKDSLVPQYGVLKEAGFTTPILVPGKIGADVALRYNIREEMLVQTSNFIGFMLDKAVEAGFSKVIIFGHLGKLIKLVGGIFHTHSHVADARQEIFAAYLASIGAKKEFISEVLAANTTEAIMTLVKEQGLERVYDVLVERAAKRCQRHVKNKLTVGVVFIDIAGNILAVDENARNLGEELKWTIK